MIRLHYSPTDASMAPHIVLHELGVPFELQLVDRSQNAQRSAEYLRLNPNGTIPVLVDGDMVMHETAATLLYLADRHPEARLAPPPGTPERGPFYAQLFWLSNTLQASLMGYFYPQRYTDDAAPSAIEAVKRQSQRRVGAQLDLLDAGIRARGGPWLMGAEHTVADAFGLMLCRWTRNFDPIIAAPARDLPALRPWLERVLARPSVQRVYADEKIPEPWF